MCRWKELKGLSSKWRRGRGVAGKRQKLYPIEKSWEIVFFGVFLCQNRAKWQKNWFGSIGR